MRQLSTVLFLLLGLSLLSGQAFVAASVPPTFEFIQNQGQWPAVVRFAVPLPAGQLFVENGGFTYALAESRPHPRPGTTDSSTFQPRRGHAYRVYLDGANEEARPTGHQPTSLLRNYFQGSNPATWASNVLSFGEVAYEQLYPHISLRLYENAQQQLEYTFTVQPGGQPSGIGLRYEGANHLSLDPEGNLRIATSVGLVTELAPHAWQTAANGQRQPVACAFALEKNLVRFRLGDYDPSRPLVIDPTIVFATFSGATADNWGHTATYDAQGNFYSAGTVFDIGYPASPGAFDPTFNGSVDVAIIKYNPATTGPAARVYATYLGGTEADVPHRLVVDAQGELVILGTTSSADFPITAGAYDPSFNGGPQPQTGTDGIAYRQGADLFLARLSADGSQLRGSTFLGGTGTDGFGFDYAPVIGGPPGIEPGTLLRFLGDVQLDAAGNVCVATSTNSQNFPTAAAVSATYRGGRSDAVVCQLSPDLRQLRWSTFLGGADVDAAYALVPDRQGGVYVAGGTRSSNFPFSATAYQSTAGGRTDGFVAHLSASGRVLLGASRLGTTNDDVVRLMQLDAAGNVLVLGQSTGRMPVTPGCYGAPGYNFVQALSPALDQLLFAATVGAAGASYAMPADIAFGVDECDRIYVATMAYPDQVVASPGTPSPPRSRCFYALRLSAGARTLEYATVLPGEHVHGTSRFDAHGNLYLAVCGNCDAEDSFALPLGINTFAAHTATGKCNDASLKINLSPVLPGNVAPQAVCADAAPLLLGGSPAGGTWAGPGVGPVPGGGYQFVPSVALLGPQVLTYTPPGSTCPIASQQVTVIAPTAISITPIASSICYDGSGNLQQVLLSAQPTGGAFSGPGVSNYTSGTSSGLFNPNIAGPGTHTITYTLSQNGQCGSATQTVTVRGTRIRIFPQDTVICGDTPRPFQLRALPTGGVWSGLYISPTGYWSPTIVNPNSYNAAYTYTSPDGCVTRQSYSVRTYSDLTPNITVTPPTCPNFPDFNALAPFDFTFPAQTKDAGYYWEYGDGTFSGGYVGSMPAQTHTYRYPGNYTATLNIQYGANCTRTVQYAFVVGESQMLPNIITPNGDGFNEFFVQRQFCAAPALRIFSRWGQEVYHTEHYLNDWNAPNLPDGIYYYRFTAEQAPTVKGWVEVRR